MSTDIKLVNKKGDSCKVKKHEEGSTYPIGGTTGAELSVTYNYAWFWYKFLDKEKGIHFLNNKKAEDCIEKMKSCIHKLITPDCFGSGKNKDKDYWSPTPGNACHALNILLDWAKQHPRAIFNVE